MERQYQQRGLRVPSRTTRHPVVTRTGNFHLAARGLSNSNIPILSHGHPTRSAGERYVRDRRDVRTGKVLWVTLGPDGCALVATEIDRLESRSGSGNQDSATGSRFMDLRWIVRAPPQVRAPDTAASTDIPTKPISNRPATYGSDNNATMAAAAAKPATRERLAALKLPERSSASSPRKAPIAAVVATTAPTAPPMKRAKPASPTSPGAVQSGRLARTNMPAVTAPSTAPAVTPEANNATQ